MCAVRSRASRLRSRCERRKSSSSTEVSRVSQLSVPHPSTVLVACRRAIRLAWKRQPLALLGLRLVTALRAVPAPGSSLENALDIVVPGDPAAAGCADAPSDWARPRGRALPERGADGQAANTGVNCRWANGLGARAAVLGWLRFLPVGRELGRRFGSPERLVIKWYLRKDAVNVAFRFRPDHGLRRGPDHERWNGIQPSARSPGI
jgi:hypothetical protein